MDAEDLSDSPFMMEERHGPPGAVSVTTGPLTEEECRGGARAIREGAAALGVTLEGQHDLERLARACDHLASLIEESARLKRVPEPSRQNVEMFMMAEQAFRLAPILKMASRVDGSGKVAKWIRGRLNRLETQSAEAQDHLFELEIASSLARWNGLGLGVALEEPDIVLTLPEGRMALAIKRPRRLKSVGGAIEKARKQVQRSGLKGLVVIGTEALFHHSGDPARPTVLYSVSTDEDAIAEGQRLVREAANEARRDLVETCFTDSGVGGVLFFGVLTYVCANPVPAYAHRYISAIFPNNGYPAARETLEGLAQFLLDNPAVPGKQSLTAP